MKKFARWTLNILLSLVFTVLFLILLLYFPPVQNWVVKRVAAYASEQTGMNITLEHVRIAFPLDIDLQKLTATKEDTLLDVQHVLVDLDFTKIFQGHLVVDAIDIQQGKVNTDDLIATLTVQGHLGNFHLNADDIALKEQSVRLNFASLDSCDLDISMRDTTVVDTTESEPILWRILVDSIQVRDTRVAFHTKRDTMTVQTGVRDLALQGGDIDLGKNVYKIKHAYLEADSAHYDLTYEPKIGKGFDYNHIAAYDVKADITDFSYVLDTNDLQVNVNKLEGREQSGLDLSSLNGNIRLDSNSVHIPDLKLFTAHSNILGSIDLEWSALTPHGGGHFNADLTASVAREDILTFTAGLLPKDVLSLIPSEPVSLALTADGNVDTLNIEKCHLMVSPMADIKVAGTATNVMDMDHLGADLDWDIKTYDLRPIARYAKLGSDIRLPQMRITGTTNLHDPAYRANLKLAQGKGVVTLKAKYNNATQVYAANATVKNLNVHNFLPKDSIYTVSGTAQVSGKGLDIYSTRTRLDAKANISHLRYGHKNIDNAVATVKLRNGYGVLDVACHNGLLSAEACAEARISRKISLAQFSLDLNRVDLYALGLVDKPFVASLLMHIDGSSNLKNTHRVQGTLQAIELNVNDTIYHPLDLQFSLYTSPDSIYASAYDGDLELDFTASQGYERVLKHINRFTSELDKQLRNHYVDQAVLRSLLPTCTLHLHSGHENPIGRFLASIGYSFEELKFDLDSNNIDGLNGDGYVHALNTGAILLDTIQCHIYQDSTGVLNLSSRVKNGPKNKQVQFEASMDANLTPKGADAHLQFIDAKGVKGVDLGAELTAEEDGLRLHMTPLDPVIAYRGFTLNDDNYVLLHRDNHVEANVDLLADDGTGFKLYSTPNETALQDITLQVHDFNLGELSSVLPYMPVVTGFLEGDFHLVQEENSTSVLIDAQVKDMTYEGAEMGTVGMNAVYLPNSDGSHYVDGIITHDGDEVLLLAGTYRPNESSGGDIDAQATLQRFPLNMANGFIPNQMAELQGYAVGELDVSGPVSAPILNGALALDSMHVNSDMYSLHLRFPNDTIQVQNSVLDFSRIEAYSSGKNPVVLDGTINLQNLDAIGLNLSMKANNFELINAPKTRKAVAYGKVYVDLDTRLTGTLNNMYLRGNLNVMGKTDVTYVLTDSPLTVEDELADLVTFVDFTDTTEVLEEAASPQNIDMRMNISIEDAAQVHVLLSNDGVNYVNLEGGGDLTFTYSTRDDMHLYGRYTVVDGKMNYTLMVMALRDMKITNGSYVEWTGDVMNPRLSLSATEHLKTTVTENSVPRSVAFDVGLEISQTLDDMGLTFNLEAPEDLSISNEIATMSTEERGKVAVTLLATGMYITDSASGTSGLSTSNALNAFLQNQISMISNKALSTIDLNFGVDNTSTASGATQTDYSFSFAKRFWGNRISLIVGGKVSSGSEAVNTGQSIIDNVSLEYRLDKGASRYVRLYYDRNTESLLEGEIMEMGAGIVLRKKSTRLGDLFIFRNRKKE